jgi:hypothetical protein
MTDARLLAGSILLLAIASCASTVSFDRVSTNTYPKTDAVEVLASDPTDVDLEVLGALTLKSATLNQELIDKLASAAEELGADAIVVEIEERGRLGSRMPLEGSTARLEEGTMMGVDTRAVRIDVRAVKYHELGTFSGS